MSDQPSQNNEITIQSLLEAPEATLQILWQLMVNATELINSLLHHINTHPDFDTWLTEWTIAVLVIDSFIKTAKIQSPYREMPSRFITSAQNLVKEIFKSWFEIQRQKRQSLNGKRRFLDILKSNEELLIESDCTFDTLCSEAEIILEQIQQQIEQKRQDENQPPPIDDKKAFWELSKAFYEAYDQADTPLTRSCIALLLKNQNQVPSQPEDPEKYQQRRKAKLEEIERLEQQLQAKAPKGRQIDRQEWLRILERASQPITEVSEFIDIQTQLLRKFSTLVYPVTFGSNTDLKWLINEHGRICVQFHGMRKYTFEIACNKRQLHWFKRFLADYQLYEQHDEQVPTGLMPLRCARLVWTEGQDDFALMVAIWLLIPLLQHKLYTIAFLILKNRRLIKSPPWLVHHLHLHCTVDHRLWTQEGKEIVKGEKIPETQKLIDGFKKKEEKQENGLTTGQQQRLKANETSLRLLQTCDHFTASGRPPYRGQPNRILGVSVGLHDPVTIMVVDTTTGKTLTSRNTKQLLNKKRQVRDEQPKQPKYEECQQFRHIYKEISDYELFLSYRLYKQQNQHQRHKAQIKAAPDNSREANLGLYINQLLAKAIIEVAQQYQVSTIILPDPKNKREIIESEIIARAKLKIPKNKKIQQQYTKNILSQVSQWSYKQLSDCITSKASQSGIALEIIQQIIQGSPYEKVKNLITTFMKKGQEQCSAKIE